MLAGLHDTEITTFIYWNNAHRNVFLMDKQLSLKQHDSFVTGFIREFSFESKTVCLTISDMYSAYVELLIMY